MFVVRNSEKGKYVSKRIMSDGVNFFGSFGVPKCRDMKNTIFLSWSHIFLYCLKYIGDKCGVWGTRFEYSASSKHVQNNYCNMSGNLN